MSHIKKSHAEGVVGAASRLLLVALFLSFCGWCFEVVGRLLVYRQLTDRGFLSLPLCPIYGISVVLIYLLVGVPSHPSGLLGATCARSAWWKAHIEGRVWLRLPLYFAFVTVASTAAELVTGLTAKALGAPLWNYEDRAFNLFGVVCLSYSLLWGALITLFMTFLWKPLYCAFGKIPKDTATALALWGAIPVSVDFVVNVIYLLVTGERL